MKCIVDRPVSCPERFLWHLVSGGMLLRFAWIPCTTLGKQEYEKLVYIDLGRRNHGILEVAIPGTNVASGRAQIYIEPEAESGAGTEDLVRLAANYPDMCGPLKDPEALAKLHLLDALGWKPFENPDKVRQSGQAALALDRSLGRAWNCIGVTYERQQDVTEATDHYLRAVSVDPKLVRGWSNLGITYAGQNEERSFLARRIAVGLDPEHPDDPLFQARIFMDLHEYEQAVKSYELYLEYDPFDREAMEVGKRAAARVKRPKRISPDTIIVMRIHNQLRDRELFLEEQNESIDDSDPFQVGIRNMVKGNWQNALAKFREAAEKSGEKVAENNVAHALIHLRQYGEALTVCDRLVNKWPNSAYTRETRATTLMKLGRWSEALSEYELTVTKSPLNSALRYARAAAADYLGQVDTARMSFRDSIHATLCSKDRTNEYSNNRLCFYDHWFPENSQSVPREGTQTKNNTLEDVEGRLKTCSDLQRDQSIQPDGYHNLMFTGGMPMDVRVLNRNSIARSYFQQGDWKKALIELRKLGDYTEDLDLQYQIAYCLSQLGQIDKAENVAHQILTFAKSHVGALLILAEVAIRRGLVASPSEKPEYWRQGIEFLRRAVEIDATSVEALMARVMAIDVIVTDTRSSQGLESISSSDPYLNQLLVLQDKSLRQLIVVARTENKKQEEYAWIRLAELEFWNE